MDRTTRAQQRAAAIDVSPAKLAAEIERLARERDLARRQADAARAELAQLKGGNGSAKGSGATVEDLTRERDEYLAALQRERAEFTNFRRRTAEEWEANIGLAGESLIKKVLALADDFDLAVEHRPQGGVDEAWVEGIAAIDRKLRQLLESEGVRPIEVAPGARFDPREHEAVATVPGTGRRGGEIVDQIRRGYRLRDRVIRPALVAVAEDHGAEAGQEPDEPAEPIH